MHCRFPRPCFVALSCKNKPASYKLARFAPEFIPEFNAQAQKKVIVQSHSCADFESPPHMHEPTIVLGRHPTKMPCARIAPCPLQRTEGRIVISSLIGSPPTCTCQFSKLDGTSSLHMAANGHGDLAKLFCPRQPRNATSEQAASTSPQEAMSRNRMGPKQSDGSQGTRPFSTNKERLSDKKKKCTSRQRAHP